MKEGDTDPDDEEDEEDKKEANESLLIQSSSTWTLQMVYALNVYLHPTNDFKAVVPVFEELSMLHRHGVKMDTNNFV